MSLAMSRPKIRYSKKASHYWFAFFLLYVYRQEKGSPVSNNA